MTAVRRRTGRLMTSTLTVILLAGCQHGSTPKMPLAPTATELQQAADKQCQHTSAASRGNCLYFAKMQYGIQRNFYPAAKYKGRECAVTITWQNGRYSVLSTEGDEVLCLKTWSVVSSAQHLPPPPKQLPPKMVIDFKP